MTLASSCIRTRTMQRVHIYKVGVSHTSASCFLCSFSKDSEALVVQKVVVVCLLTCTHPHDTLLQQNI